MHERIIESLNHIPYGVETPWGGIAWPTKSIPYILDAALQNGWIILGGDALTLECKHTYDNWYYNPDPYKSLEHNVKHSIAMCSQYTSQYITRNGDRFLFTVVISDAYVEGMG